MASGVASSRITMNSVFSATATSIDPKSVGYQHVQCKLWDEKKPNLLSVNMSPNKNYPSPIEIRSVRRSCTNSGTTDQHTLLNQDPALAGKFKDSPRHHRGTVAVVEILLRDNNGVIWNELKKLSEDFSSDNNFSTTSNMLKEILEFLVRHHKHGIHRNTSRLVFPWAEVPLLRFCQWAEYDLNNVRKRGKWLRRLISGDTSNTVFVTVIACVDTEVGYDEWKAYVNSERYDPMKDVLVKVCNYDHSSFECLASLVRWYEPGLLLYASNKSDFGRSPPPIFFKTGPSDIERQWVDY